MPDYVRVRDRDTGHEYTVRVDAVHPEAHEVLEDKPALGHDGLPREVTYRVPLGEDPAPSAAHTKPVKKAAAQASAIQETATSADQKKE